MADALGRFLALCFVLATVSYSSSANYPKLPSTRHRISDALQSLKNDLQTTKNERVWKKTVPENLDNTFEGSGNRQSTLSLDKIEKDISKAENTLSKIKKHRKHKTDHGIPQAMKPLRVVATSAVIKNRLSKQHRDVPKPVKAIHVWGPTPFKTVLDNIIQMNKRMRQQQKRLFLPFQMNHLQEFRPMPRPDNKDTQAPPFSAFSLPIKQPQLQIKPAQIIQINEHQGDSKDFVQPESVGADSRGVLQRPVYIDDQINHSAPQGVPLGVDQPNEPQDDFYNPYVHYSPYIREEQEETPEHYYRHRSHHHSVIKSRAKCDPNPCVNDGVCTAFLHDYECTCPVGYMGKHCEDVNQCLPNPCKNNGNCYPTTSGFQCTCVRGYKGENCEAISKCIPNPCKNNGACQEPTIANQDFQCICRPGYKGSNCEEADYCGSHNPCRNGGTCINGQSTHVCKCSVGFTGPDCGDIDVCRSSPCSNGGTCITSGAGLFKCQCPFMFSGYTCEEKRSRCATLPCQNGGSCIEGENNSFHCECPLRYSGTLCQTLRNPCERQPCQNNGKCLTSSDSFVCVCEPEFSGTTCEVYLPIVCHSCHVNAKCIAGKCTCLPGFIGNGNVCEGLNETMHESDSSKCHPNPCYNGGICKENQTGFTCQCLNNYVGPTCQETLPCKNQPCQHGGTCLDNEKTGTYTCICAEEYTGTNCEETTACEPNPCENGATCIPKGKSYLCKCAKRFQGPRCEEDKCSLCDVHAHCEDGKCVCDSGYSGEGTKDECFKDGASNPRFCMPNPCQNGGTCQELPQGHNCVCEPGFSGINCEKDLAAPPRKIDPCASSPCQHGGTCITEGDTFRCICTDGYKGKTCQEEVPHFCHPNPCLHGGTCQETGTGYTCKCIGAYRGQDCDIDDCDQCDLHAICIHGACRCRIGYKGDGFQCVKIKRCHRCHKYATCIANECVCNPGYTGNGQVCNVDNCQSCPSNSHCMRGACVCGNGYYFDGKHCVAPPVAAPSTSSCPEGCTTNCLPSCPQHCCKVKVFPVTVHKAKTCPQHCGSTCAATCPPKCCTEPYLPKVIPISECPDECDMHCSSSCPSHCCSHEACPANCHTNCQAYCPVRCCAPDDIPPPINPTATSMLFENEKGGSITSPVVTSCPAQCMTNCPLSCPQTCCRRTSINERALGRSLSKTKTTNASKMTTKSKYSTTAGEKPSVKAPASVTSDSNELSSESKAKLVHTLSVLLDSPLGKCPEKCSSGCSYLCPAQCCAVNSKKKTNIEKKNKDNNNNIIKNKSETDPLDKTDFNLVLDK